MSRTVTAATIQKLSFQERIPLVVRFRRASHDVSLSPTDRMMARVAARFILGNLNTPAFDLLVRVQILEGAAGVVKMGPKTHGPWSKNPRAGIRAAMDHFQGTPISPEWFSTGNTGLVSKLLRMVQTAVTQWSRGREVHFGAEDIIQNGVAGLTKDGLGQMSGGPIPMQFSIKNIGVRDAILEGRMGPLDVVGIMAKFFTQKVKDQFKGVDQNRVPTENAEGVNIIDLNTPNERDPDLAEMNITPRLQRALSRALLDEGSEMHQMLVDEIRNQLGEGKFADIAWEYLMARVRDEPIVKSEWAQRYQMQGGTFSKVLRTKLLPALELTMKALQRALLDYED